MLICLTANHRNAGFDLLEKLSVGTADVAKSLVAESDFVQGAVVLATCNRFEAYLDIDEPLTAGLSLAVEQGVGCGQSHLHILRRPTSGAAGRV